MVKSSLVMRATTVAISRCLRWLAVMSRLESESILVRRPGNAFDLTA